MAQENRIHREAYKQGERATASFQYIYDYKCIDCKAKVTSGAGNIKRCSDCAKIARNRQKRASDKRRSIADKAKAKK